MAFWEHNLTGLLNSVMGEFKIPGLDCSVYHHHQRYTGIRRGCGPEDPAPIIRNTLYNIYSNTKVITCTAVLRLFEKGKFTLEDQLDRFYPELSKLKVKTADGNKIPCAGTE